MRLFRSGDMTLATRVLIVKKLAYLSDSPNRTGLQALPSAASWQSVGRLRPARFSLREML